MKALFGIIWISPFIVNVWIPWNAFSPIFCINEGIVISFNDEHPSNADESIIVNEFVLRNTFVKDEHPSNADDPIVVQESVFIFILVNDKQFLNEFLGICIISPLIVNSFTPRKTLFSIVRIDDGIVISVNKVHPSNVDSSKDAKEDGISIFFKFEHPLKIEFWIVWIDCGNDISVKDVQPSNTDDPKELNFLESKEILVNDEQFLKVLQICIKLCPRIKLCPYV